MRRDILEDENLKRMSKKTKRFPLQAITFMKTETISTPDKTCMKSKQFTFQANTFMKIKNSFQTRQHIYETNNCLLSFTRLVFH